MRGEETPLEGVIDSFIAHRHDLSVRTAANYAWQLHRFARWCAGSVGRPTLVGDVEPGTVNAYLSDCRRTSAQQARSAWTAFRSFAAFLAERGIHHSSGESTLRLVRAPKVKDEARRALTDTEFWQLIERAESGEQGPRDKSIVVTLLGTGLRVGELAGLRLSDIDLGERMLRVRASTSKSVHPREIALPVEVVKELDRYVRDHRTGPEGDDEPLFTNRRGGPLTPNAVRHLFDRLKVRTGIRDLCAHILRHTWATNYHRAGSGTALDLQAEGGWTTPRMVNRYCKRRPLEERRRAPSPFSAPRRAASHSERRPAERRSPQKRNARPAWRVA